MSVTIINSSALTEVNGVSNASFYRNDGTLLPSGTLPKINHGTMFTTYNNNTQLLGNKGATQGFPRYNPSSIVVQGSRNVIAANLTAITNTGGAITVVNSGGYCNFSISGNGLSVGNVVAIADTSGAVNGVQMITAKGTNTITTTKPSTFVANAGTITALVPTAGYNFAKMSPRQYVMIRAGAQSEYLSGHTGFTLLRNGANYGPSTGGQFVNTLIHRFKPFASILLSTAIRNGYWNIRKGTWSNLIQNSTTVCVYTHSNAQAAATTDPEANTTILQPGMLVYKTSAPLTLITGSNSQGMTAKYPSRGQW